MKSKSQVSPRTIWTVALHGLGILGLLVIVRSTASVVAWVLIAVFLALALDPAVRWLHGRGLPRVLAVLLVFAIAAVAVTGLVATFVPMLVDQARDLVANAPEMLASFERSRLGAWAARYDLVAIVREELNQLGPDAAAPMLGVLAGVFLGVAGAVTITVLTIFMLLFGGEVFHVGLQWLTPETRAQAVDLVRRMKKTVGGFVAGSLFISLIGGVTTSIGTLLLGVPYFLPLGLLMAIFGIIPYLGSAIGAVFIVGTTFATVGVKAGAIALVAYLVYQQVENHVLQPLIQRKTIKMNPLIITLVMLFGTALFGVLGALLALPTAGALQVFLQDRLARRQAKWGEGVEAGQPGAAAAAGVASSTVPPAPLAESAPGRGQAGREEDEAKGLPGVRSPAT